MTRHGKNNTASSVFTHAERMMTGNGTKKQRFTAHSMADFDSCRLCLHTAIDPRTDEEGHLFCHECILEHILSQKKDLKRQKLILERMHAEDAAQREVALTAARQRVLRDFERVQAGISSSTLKTVKADTVPIRPELDQLATLTTEAEWAALRDLEREAAAAKRAKLPNFWLPSLTPSAEPTRPGPTPTGQLKPLCRVSNRDGNNRPHPIRLNTLLAVHFHAESSSSGGSNSKQKCCGGCRKGFNKNTKMSVLKLCGHVVCLHCVTTLVKASVPHQCPSCDKEVEGTIELEREGTGFAAGGLAEAAKFDVAFQG
ncbi:hypothetical protein CROQUDRAFT_660725 [Cronartium quercuum f. sp. fusiforme G11]|uniref:RING-type domain-containing protein n=1 Tax=Cronartium quercuum f. sp. fusiforme G11 TaxID=708437 RepID=A0A9P6NBX6_9BASI|nr:hypothetical protein CROQUDRAFT_660725 [Cronartium quercuum f. sp. fusiforme G11]